MIDFDKTTIRLLNYVNRNPGITEEELLNKFGNNCTGMLFINLSNDMYLIPQNANGQYFSYGEAPWHSYNDTRYYSSPKAKAYLQERQKKTIGELRGWITSIIALAAFIKSFFM